MTADRRRIAAIRRRDRRVARRRARARIQPAYTRSGATEFTDDPTFDDPIWVVHTLKHHPQIVDELIAATTPEHTSGRKRIAGAWCLLYLGFMLTKVQDMEPFYNRWLSSPLWELAGFERPVPSFRTMRDRFVELEQHADAFVQAANKLIQQARRHEPRIGVHVHFDGTAFHSHASLEHACPNIHYCRAAGPRKREKLAKANDEYVKNQRHADSSEPEPSDPTKAPDNALKRLTDEDVAALALDPTTHAYFIRAGHIYKCRDKSAGGRRYAATKRKDVFWLGGYFMPGVDDFTRAPLSVHFFPAHHQEYNELPDAYEKTCQAIDDEPVSAVMDRGFHIKARLEELHLCGTAPVVPFRAPHAGWTPEHLQTDMIDEEGTPRCRYCGGPGTTDGADLGLYWARGVPRIRYRCAIWDDEQCVGRTQSIAVLEEPRLLNPIPRTSRLHHDLLDAHQNMEGVFAAWRERYKVAGNDLGSRIRRRAGVSAQNLRASAALLLEWFRINLRHGWMGSHHRRNSRTPSERTGGLAALDHVLRNRDAKQLDLPYRGDVELLLARLRGSPPPP